MSSKPLLFPTTNPGRGGYSKICDFASVKIQLMTIDTNKKKYGRIKYPACMMGTRPTRDTQYSTASPESLAASHLTKCFKRPR